MASKMHSVRILLVVVASAWPVYILRAQTLASRLDDPAIEQRISKLLEQMTLEDKIGELVHSLRTAPTDLGRVAPTITSRSPRANWARSRMLLGQRKSMLCIRTQLYQVYLLTFRAEHISDEC
jgi:hypothetical protein